MMEKSVLPPLWEVPQVFRNRLGEQAGRQRAMFADGHLLLVLHRPPREDEPHRKGRLFWRSPDGNWQSSDTSLRGGIGGLKMHLDECAELIEQYDRREEQAASAEEYFRLLNALAPLHRSSRHLHQTLQEARQMCPEERNLIVLRDRAYEIERAAELLYNEAKNSLDFIVVTRAEEQARNSHRMAVAAYRLNLLAAFFFPLATLSAIFGMNLAHGLDGATAPIPFLAVLGVGLACGVLLQSYVSRPG